MENLYDIGLNSACRKIGCDELLFVEYRCLPGTYKSSLWSEYGYFAFVDYGQKIWITPEEEIVVRRGEAIYCKKGGLQVLNSHNNDVCILIFFIPDRFIREIMIEIQEEPVKPAPDEDKLILPMDVDATLASYFASVRSYFFSSKSPSRELIRLKFKELILHVLECSNQHQIAAYFHSLARSSGTDLRKIMEQNFQHPLTIPEYARLCHMSLSTFKREFYAAYKETPLKWITDQRLRYARLLLLNSDDTINEICDKSGFETTSNFIRCFKKTFGLPPKKLRHVTENSIV